MDNETSVNDLPLSNRAKNVLWRHGYEKLGDLLNLPDNELLRCVGLGKHSLAEVRALIKQYAEETNARDS